MSTRTDAPRLMVDGHPFFPLGAQVGNSSGWPTKLAELWPKAEALHLNTLEVPVYWEQMEPREGVFDDTVVEDVIGQARAHHVRLVLLWFGTWKNGKMHYVPDWVKSDTHRFPRMMTRGGQPIDVLSANAPSNLDADQKGLRSPDAQGEGDGRRSAHGDPGAGGERVWSAGQRARFLPAGAKKFDGAVPETLVTPRGRRREAGGRSSVKMRTRRFRRGALPAISAQSRRRASRSWGCRCMRTTG